MVYKPKKFVIKELVSQLVINTYGEAMCWSFFTPDVLQDLDTIRLAWGAPLVINNYSQGLHQCGFRCNKDPLVASKTRPYCSGHTMGKAFDLHAQNSKDNAKLHTLVSNLIKTGKLKAFKRMERLQDTPTWVHVDALQPIGNLLPEIVSG